MGCVVERTGVQPGRAQAGAQHRRPGPRSGAGREGLGLGRRQVPRSRADVDLDGRRATGTYDPETGAFTLEWTSYIEGGAFNGFTGLWHLEGVFEPSGRAPDDAG